MRAFLVAASIALLACTPREPPHWPEGGARLLLPTARWDRPGEDPIELRPDGRVIEDGDVLFVVDRVGRVVDDDHEPVALLLPDGRLVGTDERALGYVGVSNAAPPWSGHAWVAVRPDGSVVHFAPDGERSSGGHWQGCDGVALRTCTLVTHLVALRHSRSPGSGFSFGVGVGIGIGF
ncbi:MAG TPA: hypothetical protein VKY73_08640 [Polyangiaceae bacterium]|nr:hypothetical protein [Polyangiaceae bacterium]